ncbi:heavy-metal-associated domain-containing protein [Mangrovimonas spongiae]|uniref:Heavy-metal-associated domain-containing protein n=1 Tax=Mangrovimonas spongiae TaxID=2494697 RepID=A0A428K5R4_9FLAO|nr:heavy metal-associated domain-containing protein [Mangrovimonas spongiae]RSK41794.1 heavy-metal-associated domain-containing protein [Mangrovimonas spongiae]
MKHLKYFFAVVTISLLTIACKENTTTPEVKTVEVETSKTKKLNPNATFAKAEFNIDGMTCAVGCAKTIEKKLANMDGVKSATVDFDKELAMVEYDVATVNTSSLEETVKKAGDMYSVKNMKTLDGSSMKKGCKADCKMACCANKEEAKKETACAKDCKKPCCADKKQA